MKSKNSVLTTSILLLTSFLAFSSCKKEKNDEKEKPGRGTSSAVITADNNTINFSGSEDNSLAMLLYVKDENKYMYSMVLTDDKTGAIIGIDVFPAKEGPGTYELGELSEEAIASATVTLTGNSSSASTIYTSGYYDIQGEVTKSTGTLIITSLTKDRVKGTFSATLHNRNRDNGVIKELKISNGSFDLPVIRKDFDFEP